MKRIQGHELARAVSARLGSEMQRRRKLLGLLGDEVSQRCADLGFPIPKSTLSKIETGAKSYVSVAEMLAIATALNVPVVELLASPTSGTVLHENIMLEPATAMEVATLRAKLADANRRVDAVAEVAMRHGAGITEVVDAMNGTS